MRTKKILLNAISELIGYVVISIIAFVKVRVLINNLGSEFNGYYQFINQLLGYLFIVEAGFGSAVLFKLYKPMAYKQKEKVSAIFNGSITIFRKIGAIIFGILILITLFMPLMITNDEYLLVVIASFLIIGISQSLPYFFYSKSYSILLNSEQKNYIYSIIVNLIKIFVDVGIIIAVILSGNLISVAVILLVGKVIEEIIVDLICSKIYKWIDRKVNADTSAQKMTKDLIYHRIGDLVVNNVDSIVLMKFLGPIVVSKYSTYNYISMFLDTVINKINSGIVSTFGNIFSKEDNNTSYKLFKEFSIINDVIAFIIPICYILAARSFIKIWIGQESYIFSYITIVMFASIIFVRCLFRQINIITTAKGMFKETKYYAFIVSFTNLFLSLFLIRSHGLTGVLFATVFSYIVSLFLRMRLLYNTEFSFANKFKEYRTAVLKITIYIVIVFILYPIEKIIFLIDLNFISFILLFGFIFLTITTITCLFLYKSSENFKNVLTKLINPILNRRKNHE